MEKIQLIDQYEIQEFNNYIQTYPNVVIKINTHEKTLDYY